MKCHCGCGQEPKSRNSFYVKGHDTGFRVRTGNLIPPRATVERLFSTQAYLRELGLNLKIAGLQEAGDKAFVAEDAMAALSYFLRAEIVRVSGNASR